MAKIKTEETVENAVVAKLLAYAEGKEQQHPIPDEPTEVIDGDAFRRRGRPPSSEQLVYFIREGATGPVKIGVAVRPVDRLNTLQTSNAAPLRILACIPGGYARESALHRRFRHKRLRGEWFSLTKRDVLSAIADALKLDMEEEPPK